MRQDDQTQAPQGRPPPIGVAVIASLQFVGGVFLVASVAGQLATALQLGQLALGFLATALAWGMWFLKPWAWMGTLVVHILIAGTAAIDLLGRGPTKALVPLGLSLVIAAYLFAPKVRGAFAVSSQEE